MATKKCCHMPTVGTAVVTFPGKQRHTVKWCEEHLAFARDEFMLLVVRSVFPGSTEEPQARRLT